MITRDDVQQWLDDYVEAWRTYDGALIGALFSDDAEYRYHPWDEPIRGREAIVSDWLEPEGSASGRDARGTYDARYTPFAVEGDNAVATGKSEYWTDASRSTRSRTYHNCYLLRFDADGRCSSFTELFMEDPATARR